jgi:predicted DNA-binding WGR domain protein
LGSEQDELVRQWQNVKETGSASHRHFAVMERIPGKTEARLKVM